MRIYEGAIHIQTGKMQNIMLQSQKKLILSLTCLRACSTEKQRKVIEYLSVLDKEAEGSAANDEPPVVSTEFIPASLPPRPEDIETLQDFIINSKRLLVMTGWC